MANKRINELQVRTPQTTDLMLIGDPTTGYSFKTTILDALNLGVPTTRTLTINGTTFDLSANRTWNVGTVTSVGLTMPSAFTVTSSPVTGSGNITVVGAGNTTQYIAGDGSLVNFPIAGQAGTLVREVRNVSGATITKGTVVYINGASGNKPTIAKAIATTDATSAQTFGVVQNDIANNSNGYVVAYGDLIDLDTSAFTAGSQLYLSSTVAGGVTTTKQYAPNHLVYIGVVTRSHPTQGTIEVRIQNGYEMDELHDVAAQNPSDNDILQYKSSTGLWTKTAGTTTNITEGTNLYFTNARARSAISVTTFGTGGAAIYDPSTGILNIPNYSSALSGYLPLTGGTLTGQLNGTSGVFSNSVSVGRLLIEGIGGNGEVLGFKQYAGSFASGFTGYNTISTETKNAFVFSLHQNNTDFKTVYLRFSNVPLSSVATPFLELPSTSGTLALTSQIPSLSGYVQGSGTTNYVPKFTASGTIGNSLIFDNGTNVGINNTTPNRRLVIQGGAVSNDQILYLKQFDDNGFSFNIDSAVTGNLMIRGVNAGVETASILTLSRNTGAATFSSSITAGGNVLVPAGSGLAWSGDASRIMTPEDNVSGALIQTPGIIRFRTGGNEAMRINASGNVGIGVTPSAWYTGATVIQLGSVSALTDDVANKQTSLWSNTFVNSGISPIYLTNGAATFYRQTNGQHIWYNAPSGTAGNAITFTQAMTLTSNGRLGIGEPNPTTTLYVQGGFQNIAATFLRNADYGEIIQIGRQGVSIGASIGYPADNTISLLTGATERMRITSGGNLLLGTPTDPGYGRTTASIFNSTGGILQVAGSSTTALFYVFQPDNLAVIGTTTNHSFALYSNNSERMRIKSNGIINLSNVPTSSAGLSSGDIYKTVAGVLMIV